MKKNDKNLRETALKLFTGALEKVDAGKAVRDAVSIEASQLKVFKSVFDLKDFSEIYVVALGKAAMPMARALENILSGKITAGIISAPRSDESLPAHWQVIHGGHPLPNEASFEAARAAISLLRKADQSKSLVIFLISGGGSAMLELPRDENISLKDLQETNKILVGCGAAISEINSIRRCLSQVKGGGLSSMAPLAAQISLIISDTNRGDEANVASGPTIKSDSAKDVFKIAEKYRLRELLPRSVSNAIAKFSENVSLEEAIEVKNSVFILLDNQTAIAELAGAVKLLGFMTEIADDLVETPIGEGCHQLITRLMNLRQKAGGKPVALISGGEFACPVRGKGTGGRNLEATVRCLLEIQKFRSEKFKFAILNAGTDGIDGNSPAAGAIGDETTLKRAQKLQLDANEFLKKSDAYNFFEPLGDAIITGITGTNVRDIRILLAL